MLCSFTLVLTWQMLSGPSFSLPWCLCLCPPDVLTTVHFLSDVESLANGEIECTYIYVEDMNLLGVEKHVVQDWRMWSEGSHHSFNPIQDGKMCTLNENDDDDDDDKISSAKSRFSRHDVHVPCVPVELLYTVLLTQSITRGIFYKTPVKSWK